MKKEELISFLNSEDIYLEAEIQILRDRQEKYEFIIDILNQESPFVREEYTPGCPPFEVFKDKVKDEDFSGICKSDNCNYCWQLFIMKLLEE